LEQENHEEIKRVVGLPGERIRLNHGDVYLDGAVVRKNLAEQHALAILVHDDAYRASKTNPPDRWRPPNATSGWKRENSRYVIDQQTTSPQANPTKGESSFDWLEYHHWPCYAASKPRTSEAPVRDHYGWNQNTSRALNVVTDLMLVCELASLGSGILAWEAHDGSEWFRVTWEESAGELTLSRGDTNVQTRRLPQKQSSGPYHIDFSLVDQQVLFSVNGQTSISFPYDRVWPPSNATTSPFRIGARGARMTVSQLTILRDVYYLHPFGDGVKWEMKKPLASDEYFLLGDNAPLSLDSRHRPRNPLRRKSLIGIIATD
jgi:signal peptidase I